MIMVVSDHSLFSQALYKFIHDCSSLLNSSGTSCSKHAFCFFTTEDCQNHPFCSKARLCSGNGNFSSLEGACLTWPMNWLAFVRLNDILRSKNYLAFDLKSVANLCNKTRVLCMSLESCVLMCVVVIRVIETNSSCCYGNEVSWCSW